jgi:glycine cleavage system H protein
VSELYAPMSGEVVEVNSSLKDHPEVINKDPHGTWMIKVRLTNAADTGALLDSGQYQDLTK